MQLGTTIKDFRKLKGLKQKELAEKSKISSTYLSQIESNSKDPTLSTIKLLSDSLEVPLPVLLFLSLDTKDIPKSKQDAFNAIYPSIKNFVENLFIEK